MSSYSGLYNNEYGENYSLLGDDAKIGNGRTALARVFAGRLYGRAALRELINTLVSGNVGDTATTGHKRVKAERDLNMNVQGGKRSVETFTAINRATDADDVTNIDDALNLSPAPNYVGDKAGNGGGNKLGW